MTPNKEWRNVYLSIGTGILFFIVCILAYTSLSCMSGGCALAFVSFFLAVSSAAVSLLFVHRARAMDAILGDPKPLAHWTYPEDMARASTEREFRDYQERNRTMFLVIGGMLAFMALGFIILVGGDGGFATGIVLLAFTAFLFLVSRITPRIERWRAMRAPREAIITRKGLVYEGAVYPFRSFLLARGRVFFRRSERARPATLVFSFTQMVGLFIVQPFDITVPVPSGEEETAARIAEELGGE